MIGMLREITAECDRTADSVIRCRAYLDYAGIMITAERRDDKNCAAFLVSWEMISAKQVSKALEGIQDAAKRARKAA